MQNKAFFFFHFTKLWLELSSLELEVLLMVQKSFLITTWDVSSLLNNGRSYQPQLVIAGFLNHQQYHTFPPGKQGATNNPTSNTWKETHVRVNVEMCHLADGRKQEVFNQPIKSIIWLFSMISSILEFISAFFDAPLDTLRLGEFLNEFKPCWQVKKLDMLHLGNLLGAHLDTGRSVLLLQVSVVRYLHVSLEHTHYRV